MSISSKQDHSEIRSSLEDHEERIMNLERCINEVVRPFTDEIRNLTSAIKGDRYGNEGLISALDKVRRDQNQHRKLVYLGTGGWAVLVGVVIFLYNGGWRLFEVLQK